LSYVSHHAFDYILSCIMTILMNEMS